MHFKQCGSIFAKLSPVSGPNPDAPESQESEHADDLWDKLGIQHPENGQHLAFEAAWAPDGAFNIEHTHYPEEMAYVVEHCPERLAGGSWQGRALFWNASIPR